MWHHENVWSCAAHFDKKSHRRHRSSCWHALKTITMVVLTTLVLSIITEGKKLEKIVQCKDDTRGCNGQKKKKKIMTAAASSFVAVGTCTHPLAVKANPSSCCPKNSTMSVRSASPCTKMSSPKASCCERTNGMRGRKELRRRVSVGRSNYGTYGGRTNGIAIANKLSQSCWMMGFRIVCLEGEN